MDTPYFYLTEREKDSDREQADKILAVIENMRSKDYDVQAPKGEE